MDVHRSGFVEQRKQLEQAENSLIVERDERVLVKITTSDLESLLPGFSCSLIPCLTCTDHEAHFPSSDANDLIQVDNGVAAD